MKIEIENEIISIVEGDEVYIEISKNYREKIVERFKEGVFLKSESRLRGMSIKWVSTGENHMICLSENKMVLGMGSNECG